jgi:two-component system chemotaxis response regulator CheY
METTLSHACVLVADPDPDAGTLYSHILQIQPHQVTQANDGRDALVKAVRSPFALMITETRMPLIDGFSLCEILRHEAATQCVPILVVTADARAETLERAWLAGADGVVVKTFELGCLLTEVLRLLGHAGDLRDRSARLLLSAAAQRARGDAAMRQFAAGRTAAIGRHSVE